MNEIHTIGYNTFSHVLNFVSIKTLVQETNFSITGYIYIYLRVTINYLFGLKDAHCEILSLSIKSDLFEVNIDAFGKSLSLNQKEYILCEYIHPLIAETSQHGCVSPKSQGTDSFET